MSAVSIIEEKCKKHPDIRYEKKNGSITVLPETSQGFPVSYDYDGGRHTISYLSWHEEFDNQDEALNCFVFGLSSECRLQVFSKNNFQYRWIVEAKDKDGHWKAVSSTGLLFFPFWRKTTTVMLQNNFINEANAENRN
jgi:hypothetical protein